MEVDAVSAQLCQLAHRIVGINVSARRLAEWVAARIADCPQAKGKLVFWFRLVVAHLIPFIPCIEFVSSYLGTLQAIPILPGVLLTFTGEHPQVCPDKSSGSLSAQDAAVH